MVTFMPRIGTPLSDIAMHIVQSEVVGRKLPYFNGLLTEHALGLIGIGSSAPIIIGQFGSERFTEIKWRTCTSSAGIFPLRFRR